MRVSIVVPSKGCFYLDYLMKTLRDQVVKPHEVILVLKGCSPKEIDKINEHSKLNLVIVEQKKGYFTHALNLGKKVASGDIVIFTDDDAIAPKGWIKRYIKLHELYPKIAGISSRDIYIDLDSLSIKPTPDDWAHIRTYRWIFRPLLDRPHPLLKDYRLGVYITKDFKIAHGPYIPYRSCYSLPFRGVNMSFKAEYIYDVWFPEHPALIRAPGNEQYFGLQLILRGFSTIYIADNPILHIYRYNSLSRTNERNIVKNLKKEETIMNILIKNLLLKYDKTNKKI
ncbi:MAG: glycosyltransferase family 2 protein [Pyrobaculum sp.]